MFNFLASKHRQPPEYRPQEEDDEEGQLRTARSVTLHTISMKIGIIIFDRVNCLNICQDGVT